MSPLKTKIPYSLRPACEDDARALALLDAQCKLEGSAGWNESGYLGELKKTQSKVYVLTDDETDQSLGGFVVFHILEDQAEILNLAVAREFRRLGFGDLLMQALKRECIAKNVAVIKLEVRVSNEQGVSFYQRSGFNICQKRRQFYSNQEDAYTMELWLAKDPFPLN